VEPDGLEAALSQFERDAAATVRSLTIALRDAKKLQAAAAVGQLRDLRSGIDNTIKLAGQAAEAALDLRAAWTFDESEHFANGGYAAEVLVLADREGLAAFESDERILSYPVVVRVSGSDATVLIDKVKERRVRPSLLVRTLKALQDKPPRFKAGAFLEALAAAYDLAIARKAGRPGSTATLVDVYAVLTLMPGAARDYSKQEFARDLYLLDQSGEVLTKNGRTLSLPASALTRGSGVLSTVTRTGQAKVYAGISFEGPTA
jgi:hypothetical protein